MIVSVAAQLPSLSLVAASFGTIPLMGPLVNVVAVPLAAVAVPVTALRKGPGGDHVFVLAEVEGQTRAQLRRVESGPVVGDSVIILSGLEAGERVAASGSFKLREGVLVQVTDAAPAAQTAQVEEEQ